MGRPKKLPVILREDEYRRFIKAAPTRRDRMMLNLLVYTGLRISEACHLKIEHLNFTSGELLVVEGKGKKDRLIPMPKKLMKKLQKWIGSRTTGYVFPSPKLADRPVAARTIQKMVQETRAVSGIDKLVTPHKFRHAYASRLLQTGTDIREIQVLLGHSSLNTTTIYTHCDVSRLKAAVNRL